MSTFYEEIGNIDLTATLGINVDGVKKLTSTVRFCLFGGFPCPYRNAFWNGRQVHYGEGFARADDVAGHEMTHGIIDKNSQLFYWFQSGAINESLADIMGEIIDHRNPTAGDSATDWRVGEDLPDRDETGPEDPADVRRPGPDDQRPVRWQTVRAMATTAACTPTAASATRRRTSSPRAGPSTARRSRGSTQDPC